jgi:hypothetical protein
MQSTPQPNRPNLPNNQQVPSHKRRPSLFNILALLVVLALCFLFINWLLQDITGEYTTFDPELGVISMSIEKRGSNVHSKLGYGHGAYLECDSPPFPEIGDARLVFELPKKWLDQGRRNRRIIFTGHVHDDVVKGKLQDGDEVHAIELKRDLLASIRYVIQAHLPWTSE